MKVGDWVRWQCSCGCGLKGLGPIEEVYDENNALARIVITDTYTNPDISDQAGRIVQTRVRDEQPFEPTDADKLEYVTALVKGQT